jgi:hypothetical protein
MLQILSISSSKITKKMIKIVVFVVLLGGVYWYVDSILQVKREHFIIRFKEFYKIPKNKLDVIFLGSSIVHCDVNPADIWQEKGNLSYNISTIVQPFWTSYFNLIECFKYQDPKVVALEVSAATPAWDWDYFALGYALLNTYGLSFSKNKIDSV